VSYRTVAYRVSGYPAPLWSFPNPSEGRWNRAGSGPAQYLGLHPMTPWAETLRNLDRRTPDDALDLRVPLWAFVVELADDPVEIHYSDMPAHGLDPEDLVADDRTACQALAASLVAAGVTSIVVPSAALPGTRNLVVFDAATVIDYHETPVAPEDYPAALLEQDGHCACGLWGLVHYKSSPVRHAELEAFLSGTDYDFAQPPVTAASLAV
jgi:RES domain-containing protein